MPDVNYKLAATALLGAGMIGMALYRKAQRKNSKRGGLKVLVVGNGGREHAIVWRLCQSPQVKEVIAAPGSAAIAHEPKARVVGIGVEDVDALLKLAIHEKVAFTVVGPEAALAVGITDKFEAAGQRCLGPVQAAAQLETSKCYSKAFMKENNIPTAKHASFDDCAKAVAYVKTQQMPIVIKASGLAAGKGVVIAHTQQEAVQTLEDMMLKSSFGSAGKEVVVEDFLEGEELSYICLTDGKNVVPMCPCQDHKPRNDGDQGPNTGGMGAYSPVSTLTLALDREVLDTIVQPTLRGLRNRGLNYVGFLYCGLMLTQQGPKLLEYNCRLGDPEAQVIAIRSTADWAELCQAALQGRLDKAKVTWDPRSCICIVLASGDYPSSCKNKDPIQGLAAPASTSSCCSTSSPSQSKVFHSATTFSNGSYVTNGGRVLCVCCLGSGLQQAQQEAYKHVKSISWPRMHYRTDIGDKEMRRQRA